MLQSKHSVPPEKHLLPILKMVFTLGGIVKPISRITSSQTNANFGAFSVSNHLPPLDHDRQTCLSDSSGLRRLNRGSCHTPKFALLYSIKGPSMHLQWLKVQGT